MSFLQTIGVVPQNPYSKRMARILREFPWLWGTKSTWSPDESVLVIPVDLEIFGKLFRMANGLYSSHWWVHMVSGQGAEKVIEITHSTDALTSIKGVVERGWFVHHLAWTCESKTPTIFRSRRSEVSFHELLFNDNLVRLATL